mmetsp:Transcript_9714/g.24856  ORF Transcript_9714/g.24856 Transcript_9714/m.24856 type:complete len:373 (-) Transcript_9714:185-1303(-)
MGQVHSPVTAVYIKRCGSSWVRAGGAIMQGARPSCEDAQVMRCDLGPRFSPPGEAACLFAVFDGHGGSETADFAASKLASHIEQAAGTVAAADDSSIQSAFLSLDEELRGAEIAKSSGATCVAALVVADSTASSFTVKIANLGDSRALVVRNGVLVTATNDHKPADPVEEQRIKEAGGFVTAMAGVARVDGTLAVSRAFGDFEFKDKPNLAAEKQKVTAMCDIYDLRCERDDVLFLACDGIFDVKSNEDVIKYLREERITGPNAKPACEIDCGDAAARLLNSCLTDGSTDNMTALIIKLCDGAGVDQEELRPERETQEPNDAHHRERAEEFCRKYAVPGQPSPLPPREPDVVPDGTEVPPARTSSPSDNVES